MGFPLSEFVLESVIRDGLGLIRSNPAILDDLFSRFTAAHFNNQYGQSKIDELKTYITNNQIRIVQSWAMVPTTMPCYSIQMLRSDESEDLQQFDDYLEDRDSPKDPKVYADPVVPTAYDTVTGKLTIDPAANLESICPGMIFIDANSVEFDIGSGNSNMSGDKYINIGSGKEPTLNAAGQIVSRIDISRVERNMIRLKEVVSIGCHSKDDVHLSKYLYYILVWILKSRKDSMIARGIHLDKGTGGMYDRADQYQGENIFSRFLDMSCISEFDWNQTEVNLVDCFDLTIKAPNPNPDSPTATNINTSPEED
jgi:hypothetical protein